MALACGAVGCLADSPKDSSQHYPKDGAEAGTPAGERTAERAVSPPLACAHAADLGPRSTPSRRAPEVTRGFLRAELERSGAEVTEVRTEAALSEAPAVPEAPAAGESGSGAADEVHLLGVLPGTSSDRLLLVAAYGEPRVDSNGRRRDGASPSAVGLVLELARALGQAPRLYTVMVVLIDATSAPHAAMEDPPANLLDSDALPAGALHDEAIPDDQGATAARYASSRRLARRLEREGLFDRIRLAVFFDRVGETDVRIVRDLESHPVYRDDFFDAARSLGYTATFAADAPLGAPDGNHRVFVERGLGRVVAISGESPNRPTAPLAPGADEATFEACSTESLEVVGRVTLEALDRIAVRLARIDRFRDFPLTDPQAPAAALAPVDDKALSSSPVD